MLSRVLSGVSVTYVAASLNKNVCSNISLSLVHMSGLPVLDMCVGIAALLSSLLLII
jgi:hypothetical protein